MSDPLEALRGSLSDAEPPDLGAIRSRARRIERRRRVAVSSAAFVVVAVAVAGVLVRTGPSRPTNLAGPRVTTQAPTVAEQSSGNALTSSGAAKSAPEPQKGTATTSGEPAAGSYDTVSSGSEAAASKQPVALDATVSASKGAEPHHETFTLKVCNGTDTSARRDFGTAQRYDFEVSRDGKRVWRWSDGKVFAEQAGSVTWAPHTCKTWTADWNGMTSSGTPAGTGGYDVVGVLTTSPAQRTKPTSFCLDIC
jgi:hypothetical protein